MPAVLSKVCGQTFECVYPPKRAVGDGQNLQPAAVLLWLIRENEEEAKNRESGARAELILSMLLWF